MESSVQNHEHHNILGIKIAPEGIDYFNQMFMYLLILSILAQLVYMIPIKKLSTKLEFLDWSPEFRGITNFSMTGMFAFFFLFLSAIFTF